MKSNLDNLAVETKRFHCVLPSKEVVEVYATKYEAVETTEMYRVVFRTKAEEDIRIQIYAEKSKYYGSLFVNGKFWSFASSSHKSAEKLFGAILRNRLQKKFPSFEKKPSR